MSHQCIKTLWRYKLLHFSVKIRITPIWNKIARKNYFGEGDVSAIDIVIEVNDNFVLNRANLIEKVSNKIRN
jgi:hypothetical protein